MANLLGLGVFGTFGQPYGFQQAFNLDVQFSHSLDLEPNEIELFPGTELFAVKREIVRGVYSMCFCMYSYAREMNANRSTTFLGSCIVLQQVYIDADKIYEMLRELHQDLIENTQNVNNNTIQVRQAVNLIVREPSHFQSAKFGAKSIDDTPYYSTKVDPQKKYFIRTEHIESAGQVINFFDEALKNNTDVESLYFTFSDKVVDSVIRKGVLKIINWEDFSDFKNQGTKEVVRTKKGLKPIVANANAAPVPKQAPLESIAAPVKTETVKAVPDMPVNDVPVVQVPVPAPVPVPRPDKPAVAPALVGAEDGEESVIHDPSFPFDGWKEPKGPWTAEEVAKRVHEYNRLLGYAKYVQARNEDLLNRKPVGAEPVVPEPNIVEEGPRKLQYSKPDLSKEFISVEEAIEDEEKEKEPFYQRRYFPLVAFGVMVVALIFGYLVFNKHIFRKEMPDYSDTTTATTGSTDTTNQNAVQDTIAQGKSDTAAAMQKAHADSPKVADKSAMSQKTAIMLSPQTNTELSKSEVMVLSRIGVRSRTLQDITNMIFLKFPDNIGELYKHQFDDYSANLLVANKNAFQKKGADYICVTDTILHIPAYNSPKGTVVFPK